MIIYFIFHVVDGVNFLHLWIHGLHNFDIWGFQDVIVSLFFYGHEFLSMPSIFCFHIETHFLKQALFSSDAYQLTWIVSREFDFFEMRGLEIKEALGVFVPSFCLDV